MQTTSLQGEMAVWSVEHLDRTAVRRLADDATTRYLVLDVSHAQVDWSAFGWLAGCRDSLRARGGELALVGVDLQAAAAMRRYGIGERLPIYESVEAARLARTIGFCR